jgi:hypothetical protein
VDPIKDTVTHLQHQRGKVRGLDFIDCVLPMAVNVVLHQL